MGLFPAVQSLIRAENLYRPIEGEVLLIGRQDIYGLPEKLTDVEWFAQFSPARVRALDVSPFEGAEIVHDLCDRSLPEHLHGIADFIVEGSCLDNIWDPAQALRNISKMLRPGGRVVVFDHATMLNQSFVVFSPEWFFDFFAVNGYEDCQIRLGQFPSGMHRTWQLTEWWAFRPDGQRAKFSQEHSGDCFNIVIAEKGEHSTDDKTSVQAQYRELHAGRRYPALGDLYSQAHRRYAASPRRHRLAT